MNQQKEKTYEKEREWIAGCYFGVPIIVFLIVWFLDGSGIFARLWFRFLFPFLAGCWGLSMRAITLRHHKDSPFPEYVTLYPLALVMNGFAIFTILSLFGKFYSLLFFTAALPLGMLLGFYSHPSEWILMGIIKKKMSDGTN